MRNPWINDEEGTVRYTGNVPLESKESLPASFSVLMKSEDGRFYCFAGGDGPRLLWHTPDTVWYDGVDYKLAKAPVYSMSRNWYVFTTIDPLQ